MDGALCRALSLKLVHSRHCHKPPSRADQQEMPWTLAKLYPTTVTVLSDRAFFWPLWSDDHIHAVYASTEYDFEASGQLA